VKAVPNVTGEKGMDLRDYFAAVAMPSVIKKFKKGHPDGWRGIAMVAYMAADAMMEERELDGD
jgi:hypothetical protein